MRQGNDMGTQYRSAIYFTTPDQEATAREITTAYEPILARAGYGPITTEIKLAPDYYYAEDYHQQYLYKNPNGYRCHSATGVKVPV
jgi:peptide-methionine (S)-S-oxide reductase